MLQKLENIQLQEKYLKTMPKIKIAQFYSKYSFIIREHSH